MKILIRARPTTAARIRIAPLPLAVRARPLRVLDFDCEARPLHWIANDYVSKELTAIAWAWSDDPEHVTCYALGESDPVEILEAFRAVYNQADIVTGHYIRGFDLPLVNAMMTEQRLPPLGDKLASDTKIDAVRRHGLSSSQENWGAMLGLEHPKVGMNQQLWREANRLTPEGIAASKERVIGDVRQHMELRHWMLRLGYLGPAVLWKSGASNDVPAYTP